MSVTTVFKSQHPSVFEAIDRCKVAVAKFSEAVGDFHQELFGSRAFTIATQGGRIIGFVGVKKTLPDGWHLHPKDKSIAYPRKSSSAGKKSAKRFEAIGKEPTIRDFLPGMPHIYLASGAVRGFNLFEPGFLWTPEVAWVWWGCELPDSEVDLSIWTRAKLSEFYAAKESLEAAKQRKETA